METINKPRALGTELPAREVRVHLRHAGPPLTDSGHEFNSPDRITSLLSQISEKVGWVPNLTGMHAQIVDMTRRALKASASSILLFDEQAQELVFDVVEGDAGEILNKVRLPLDSGIAGWVARNSEAAMVNDVKQDSRFCPDMDHKSGFATRSIICAPMLAHRKLVGVIEVLNKADGGDFSSEDLETLKSVASTVAMVIENSILQQTLADEYRSTLGALAAAIDAKDPYTHGHSERVTRFALLTAKALRLTRKDLDSLEYGGLLHDVGKIGISDSILTKTGRLTIEEFAILKRHPAIGGDILKNIAFLADARELVVHHHEKYDGSGYPDGLKGLDIPLGARILAVADAFDAMTSDRPYRHSLGTSAALEELRLYSGTQFCPEASNAFVAAVTARIGK